jgi:hypothetical protein
VTPERVDNKAKIAAINYLLFIIKLWRFASW